MNHTALQFYNVKHVHVTEKSGALRIHFNDTTIQLFSGNGAIKIEGSGPACDLFKGFVWKSSEDLKIERKKTALLEEQVKALKRSLRTAKGDYTKLKNKRR